MATSISYDELRNKTPIQKHLYYLKRAKPRAQGGYGLAILPPDDQETIPQYLERLKTETQEQVVMVSLQDGRRLVKLRELLGLIAGRPLTRGQSTISFKFNYFREHHPNLIIIDHAETLHPESLGWICENLRTVTDQFLLVARDKDRFVELAGKLGGGAGWALGRAIQVDLPGVLQGNLEALFAH
jgi:hypothetical protein